MLHGVLNGVLPLGNIRDVEKACDRLVEQHLRARRSTLTPSERDDLLAYLIGETWVLWRRYDPGRGASFTTFAYPQLRLRILDWYKIRIGRGASPGHWGVSDIGALDDDELERSLGARDGDDPFDIVSSRLGLLAAGGGQARGMVDAGRGDAARGAA